MQLSDYDYPLPAARIAEFPLPRGQAKLLHYTAAGMAHRRFSDVVELLSPRHLLVFNNTKVLPARLHFMKDTGAVIEVFLLEPVSPSAEVAQAMLAKGGSVWRCAIGNLKKWKEGQTLTAPGFPLQATLHSREAQEVELSWEGDASFAEVVEAVGKIPLPPYIKREANAGDSDTYQTVYSKHRGAVAAPTAGLHFSEEILHALDDKGVQRLELTLHVGAGTFQPVKTENILEHTMHYEQVSVPIEAVEALLGDKEVVAVGTTSMRTLESLYWFGAKLCLGLGNEFVIHKSDPYRNNVQLPDLQESMSAILHKMKKEGLRELKGQTGIFIYPSYTFRVCKGLITNFHQPKSTLAMLVAAFLGYGQWKEVYEEALAQDYRFLSYGDSSFLQPAQR